MPILGRFPVVPTPTEVVSPFADSRRLGFTNLDGSATLEFTGNEFIALWGAQGLDIPDRDIVEGEVPGVDGTFIDDMKIGSRTVVLPIFFGSKSGHVPFLAQRTYLRSFFNHRGVDLAAEDGTLDLVASSAVGVRTLRCMYRSGLAGDWARDTNGSWWQRSAVTLLAVRTYWYGERWSTPVIRTPTAASFFGVFPPHLSSSRAVGTDIPVTVGGEVESWARVDAVGPCTSLLVEAPGLHLSIPAGLGVGEVAAIDTDPRRRRAGGAVTFNGVEDWTRIAPDDMWAPLAPGAQAIDVVLTGTAAGTQIVVSGDTRWETPW